MPEDFSAIAAVSMCQRISMPRDHLPCRADCRHQALRCFRKNVLTVRKFVAVTLSGSFLRKYTTLPLLMGGNVVEQVNKPAVLIRNTITSNLGISKNLNNIC